MRAISRAFSEKEASLLVQLDTAQKERDEALKELAGRTTQLTEEAERHKSLALHLADSERMLSVQLEALREQLRAQLERAEAKEAESARLTAEIDAIRLETVQREGRALDALQSVVKDLSAEHRLTTESLGRLGFERERMLSASNLAMEQDLRSQLARLHGSQLQSRMLADRLQTELEAASAPWFRRLLYRRREDLPRQMVVPLADLGSQSIESANTGEGLSVQLGAVAAESAGQATLSSIKNSESIMASNSNIGNSRPDLEALLELNGETFVKSAYLAILKRPPDTEGARFFLEKLESGTLKLLVLRHLIESDEAKVRVFENAALYAEIQQRMPKWMILRGHISRALRRGKNSKLDLLTNVLERDGQDFVHAAYNVLLHRDPDASGKNFYLAELFAGHPKIDILASIYRSAERKRLGVDLAGLKSRLMRQRVARLPVIGDVFTRRRSEGYTASDFRLRRVDQRLGALSDGLNVLAINFQSNNDLLERRLSDLFARQNQSQSNNAPNVHASESPQNADRNPQHSKFLTATRLKSKISPARAARFPLPAIYFFVDHTVQCPVNTGMQRVVRRLGRALLEQGQPIVFVKWDATLKELILTSQEDLVYLSKWNGPQLDQAQLSAYPMAHADAQPIRREKISGSWLLVPEVTHITYHAQPVTLDILFAARRLNLYISFIYYDAIPLRLPSYKDTAERHERYMQQLLLADLIVPISNRSAGELNSFLHAYQGNTGITPAVYALPLPAESQLTARLFNASIPSTSYKTILCVGSIEPRKNQIALLEAFQLLSDQQHNFSWRLILAGNLRGDVAATVMEFIARNDKISHLQNIPDPELDVLYRACSFTVFPSVEEGFGLPILESLWYAKPCICANFGAMAEVAGGGGCYSVDTRSVAELHAALAKMTSSADLRTRLSTEASRRNLTTWNDYSDNIVTLLQSSSDVALKLNRIYYWIDNTCVNVSNSGIQRVTRQLAKALITLGVELVPACWDGAKNCLVQTTKAELDHLALWEGPSSTAWSPWVEPPQEPDSYSSWLLIPELTHGELAGVKRYASTVGLKCAALFYDSIPFKFKDDYGREFGENHEAYMLELFGFDAVLPISEFSRRDLLTFYISRSDIRAIALDQRIKTQLLPDEFASSKRQRTPKTSADGVVRILSVVSIEPRKNVLTLLTAFHNAQKYTKSKLQLTLVGRRIPAFTKLAEEVEKRIGKDSGVVWEEDVNDIRLTELYQACDFTVFPSLEEGYGLPIVESLWNGRPCICHNEGAMREVADGGGCVLVDMHDARVLSEALVHLAESPSARSNLAAAAGDRPVRSWADYGLGIVNTLIELSRVPARQPAALVSDVLRLHQELPNLQRRPLLTVSISTYNRAGWLEVALKNLARLVSTPLAEVELLVCDNCSTDNTSDIVKPYISRSDFRYVRNPENVGMLGNLSVTSNLARGEYIWILGDDDLPFTGSINKILDKIKENRDAALIYLNYTYTRETDPTSVSDIEAFLSSGTLVAAPTADKVALVREIATVNENLFTAIYCIVFRRDHALRAYCQDTSGRPFSTMRTSIPTTAHVLTSMMNEKAVWIGDPQVLVNFNVSWNSYASLQILERVPEALDLAELNGADSEGIDRLRKNLIPGYVHYFKEIYGADQLENWKYFSVLRVVSRAKHLKEYEEIAPKLYEVYSRAFAVGHPAATIDPKYIFKQ